MSLAQALSSYFTLNLLIAVAFLGLGLSAVEGRVGLRLHYRALALVFLLVSLHPLLPRKAIFEPVAKVWSAQSLKTFSQDYSASGKGGYLGLSSQGADSGVRGDRISFLLLVFLAVAGAFGFLRLGRDLLRLRGTRKRSYLLRRFRGVTILVNDRIVVPFSYWIPGCAVVMIPNTLMGKGGDFRMAIAHELQHHRQADTKWIYGLWFLKTLCLLNPLVHLWSRRISELQEFACDETLVDRNKVESRQYARCLVEVAETALNQKGIPACATGLAFLVERNLLRRRIEKMINPSKNKVSRSISGWVSGALFVLMAATAFASQSIVQDRRVSLAEAREMAARVKSESGFPIVVNELVLKELNRYIGTPEGREFMRSSLQRMESYRALVESKIREYEVPMELMAVPIVESGYQNLAQSQHAGWGAGVWMFIASTARVYGLRVDQQVDERLNAELLTDAAMRYLKRNHLLFNDWLLSVLAYNVGESRVREAIQATGSHDAWALARAGHENDKSYLARVMAAVLILRNPESVRQ